MVTERKRKKISEINSSYVKQEGHLVKEKARRKRGVIRRVSALTLLFIVLGTIGMITIYTQSQVINEKEIEKEVLEGEFAKLEKEELQLEREIENYNDLDYIAEIARRDYFLTKEGEILFRLPKTSTN